MKAVSYLVVLALMALAVFSAFFGFAFASQRVLTDFNGSVALGCLTIVISTCVALWQFDKTKRKEAEARIFAQRAPIYQRLISVIRNMMFATKGWAEERETEDLAKELAEITYEMIVWGGQDTVRAIRNFTSQDGSDPGQGVRAMAELFRAVRKDLGHSDDASLPNDLVLQLIAVDDREEILRHLTAAAPKP